ncbi:MAG: hypothetical protein QOI09_16, partial [Chloroflexota bacterium]|nr:hypothetical protein [Chloroflexota bacterium]
MWRAGAAVLHRREGVRQDAGDAAAGDVVPPERTVSGAVVLVL